MKRMKLGLVMVLAMILAVPVVGQAAADVTVTGDTTFRTAVGYDSDEHLTLMGNWRTRANIDFRAGRNNISAYARYRARTADFMPFGQGAFTDSVSGGSLSNNVFVDLTDAYVDVKGTFLPSVADNLTLRVGRWDDDVVNWAGNVGLWIGDVGRNEAVLARFGVAGVDGGLYHAFLNANERLTAIGAKTKIDVVELSGAYVGYRDHAASDPDQESSADYAVAAKVTPADGITIEAGYASNGARKRTTSVFWGDPASAWVVKGTLATIDNLTLRASTWSTDENFRPVYRRLASTESLDFDRMWTAGNSRASSAWGDPWLETGFSVGLSTTQGGLPIDVDFKSGTIFGSNLPGEVQSGAVALGGSGTIGRSHAAYADKAMSSVKVGTKIAEVNASVVYTTIEDFEPVIDLVASRAFAVQQLGGNVTVKGTVRLQDDETKFAADATWNAPNGLSLGLHYANYDRVLDWGHNNDAGNLFEGVNVGKPGEADGFAITAGYQFNW